MSLGAKMKEQEERSLRHTDALMRLGFRAPVYGNWIVSKHPETAQKQNLRQRPAGGGA